MDTKIIAHRGAAGNYPENTLLAFEKAVESGAHGVEFDVQLSCDKIPVVIHDEKVDRTTDGTGLVGELTFSEIKNLDSGSKFEGDFAGLKIPTLREVLEVVQDCAIINIELKNFLPNPGLETRVINAIQDYSLEEEVIISSFNHYSILEIKRIAPHLKTAFLVASRLIEPVEYVKKQGIEALHPYFLSLSPEIVDKAHQQGIEVNTYTVDDRESMQKVLELGVDGIITNYPGLALQVSRQYSEENAD